jgi:hypothetical protein
MQNQILESAFAAHRSTLMKNVLVKPIEGTVLESIVKQSPAFYKDIDQNVSRAVDSSAPYTEIETAVTNVSNHLSSYQETYESTLRTLIDEKSKEVSQIVLSHLKFVKEVVNPICRDFVQNYNDLTKEPIDPTSDFNLIKVKSNPVLSNSSWTQSMIQEYDNAAGAAKQYPTGHFPLPVMTFPQVCEVIVGHYNDQGSEIFEYLQSLGSDSVMNHLAGTFGWPKINDKASLPNIRDNDTIMYLFSSAMYDHPVQGTEHTLGNYNDRMKSYIISCGYALVKFHIRDYMNSIANSQVIIRINGSNIFLNETIYNSFIADSGNDIRLLGFVVNKEHVGMSTLEEFKKNAGIYENAWSKFVLNRKNEYDIKAASHARQIYLFLAEKIIKENTAVIEQFCKDVGCSLEKLINNYYENVKYNQARYPEHMLVEPQRMAMDLMGYLFPGSSVKNIYSISLDVESNNQEYTPQEVWQITSYRYICQYYFDQICVYRK